MYYDEDRANLKITGIVLALIICMFCFLVGMGKLQNWQHYNKTVKYWTPNAYMIETDGRRTAVYIDKYPTQAGNYYILYFRGGQKLIVSDAKFEMIPGGPL
jgi:hypothetical protein